MWADVYKAGESFFQIMKQNEESLKFLTYDSCFQFTCEDNSFIVKAVGKKVVEIKEGQHSNGLYDLILISDEITFLDLFKGKISPANLLYHGKIRIPAQKAKHSQLTALFQAMRKNQEDLYIKDWKNIPSN